MPRRSLSSLFHLTPPPELSRFLDAADKPPRPCDESLDVAASRIDASDKPLNHHPNR